MDGFNKYQSTVESLGLKDRPAEIQEQFADFINNVPFIKNLISPERKRACELPRDKDGRAIIDLTEPHILEDMDYFRPSAIHFMQHGCYTKLRPNANPQSEFGKWIKEEIRRCHEGYVRESDGEWIPGDYYFFLNYSPMTMVVGDEDSDTEGHRVIGFPWVWEGHYMLYHYKWQARRNGHHSAVLAARGVGKTSTGASELAKRFVLGESPKVNKKVASIATAYDKKYLTNGADQTLDKFQFIIDFLAENTQFPRKRLASSPKNMEWVMGFYNLETGTRQGTLNSVTGISAKDDTDKLRGSRGVYYIIEEFGAFKNLKKLYNTLRPSVEQGKKTFGLINMIGTSSEIDSNFESAKELITNPIGYNINAVKNLYDKYGQGRPYFSFFFPSYINRDGCYDKNGNSDVTKALLEILEDRYKVKYNTDDLNALSRRIGEYPITPQEAMLKVRNNLFPIQQLTDRINQLDNNPNSFDDIYVGKLDIKTNGEVVFVPTNDVPIRKYPLGDNKAHGAIEIFSMPLKDSTNKVPRERYIISFDPVDSDESETMSLVSAFVLDLWTDKIVAEYTGRQDRADDNYEIVRRLCMFYNAKCLYENNIKGTYQYFVRLNCTYLLADTPEYLKDRDIIKQTGYGNVNKGVAATMPINNYADRLIKEWLLKPVTVVSKDEQGNEHENTVPNLYFIKNRALLQELANYDDKNNFDRVRSLGMLMLYREAFIVRYGGTVGEKPDKSKDPAYRANDPFFKKNYDDRIGISL